MAKEQEKTISFKSVQLLKDQTLGIGCSHRCSPEEGQTGADMR